MMVSLSSILSVVIVGYNCFIPVSAQDGGVIYSLDDFKPYYDENGRLGTHLLLYPESCSSIMDARLLTPLKEKSHPNQDRFFGRKIHAVAGSAEQAFFGTTNAGRTMQCNAVCVERGMDQSLINNPMPHLFYRRRGEDGSLTNDNKRIGDWYRENCESVEFGFINYYSTEKVLNINWIDFDGNRIPVFKMPYSEKHQQIIPTFIGHTFQIEDPDTGEVLLEHVVEFEGIRTVGNYVIPEDLRKVNRDSIEESLKKDLDMQWDAHKKVKRSFSTNGFAKGRLPDDVFGSMGAYYYNNQQYIYMEEWGIAAQVFSVNWWENDVHFINVPWRSKNMWHARLLTLVEEWTRTKLEQTVMYGIRQYEPGARLMTHVDRLTTHAASLIVNIAQGNITEPWRVEVYDHADRLHEVIMEPGDIVYYESAKMLHGRNTPLKGGYYANIFTHYRPMGDPQWYEKENPEGTPEPLLDVGECQLVGPTDAYSQGSVKCDDPRIGPHLSPTMFAAKSSDDLFNWWKYSSPQITQRVPGNREGEL